MTDLGFVMTACYIVISELRPMHVGWLWEKSTLHELLKITSDMTDLSFIMTAFYFVISELRPMSSDESNAPRVVINFDLRYDKPPRHHIG
jgi:hypothetical protein